MYESMNYLFNPDPQFLINEAATPMRSDVKFEDCKSICDQTNGCESFSYCNDGSCYPHKRHLNGAEKSFESGVEHECFTSFKIGRLHIQNHKFYHEHCKIDIDNYEGKNLRPSFTMK